MMIRSGILKLSIVLMAGGLVACQNGSSGGGAAQSEVSELRAKTIEQQKAIQELSQQVRTLNEESNRLKSLVSQLTDGVLAQKQSLQNLSAKPAAVPTPVPPPAPKPTFKATSSSRSNTGKNSSRSSSVRSNSSSSRFNTRLSNRSSKPTPKPSPKKKNNSRR